MTTLSDKIKTYEKKSGDYRKANVAYFSSLNKTKLVNIPNMKIVITESRPTLPWKCLPNINVPLRKNAQGDVECMSEDGKGCLWKSNATECNKLITSQPSNFQPLACGEMHKRLWGGTGYDVSSHWCAKGKLAFADTATTTQNNVGKCSAVCSAASSTCKGATFNSASKTCTTFTSNIGSANIVESIGDNAIVSDSLNKLLIVQKLNAELIVLSKEIIDASESSVNTNYTVQNNQRIKLNTDYDNLLTERASIDEEIEKFKNTEDKVDVTSLVVNQKYYSYLGLLFVVILFVFLFILIVFVSSPSNNNNNSYMLSSMQRGGSKLSNNIYYLIFGVIIVSSLFFQVR